MFCKVHKCILIQGDTEGGRGVRGIQLNYLLHRKQATWTPSRNWPIKPEWPMEVEMSFILGRDIKHICKMYLLLQEGKPEIKSVTKAWKGEGIDLSKSEWTEICILEWLLPCQSNRELSTVATQPAVVTQSWKVISHLHFFSLYSSVVEYILFISGADPGICDKKVGFAGQVGTSVSVSFPSLPANG